MLRRKSVELIERKSNKRFVGCGGQGFLIAINELRMALCFGKQPQ